MIQRPSIAETAGQLYLGWRLLWLNRKALASFGRTEEAFWKSFWCAAFVLPLHVLRLTFGQEYYRPDIEWSLFWAVTVESLIYLISWIIWPVVIAPICRLMNQSQQFIPYICALNWNNGVFYLLLTPLILLEAAGLIAHDLYQTLLFGFFFWKIGLHIFIVTTLLKQLVPTAILIVLGNVILVLTVAATRQAILH
ncbi:hypothetical protein [Aestuariispira insulae]|uniref:Yip1-like protein n=1 Tax=Aestuariispira insulae TaxID=1461337 RepID=A0A3D9HEZ4_9PROT|nr:hypothetical protein [Aestuariispira insulae]RED48048.1 hypothetical protein DFP90_10866 [Aestuariispira insulae]